MGSDGLWDNLSESEILELVENTFTGTRYQRGLGAESQQTLTAASVGAVVTAASARHGQTKDHALLPRRHRKFRHGVLGREEG